MSNVRLLDDHDIQELLNKNSAPPLGRRNAALIMGSVYWGLTLYELSELTVQSAIAENGELYKIWVLPKHESYNGEERECRTKDHVLAFFEGWIKFRIQKKWGMCNLSSHQGLDPNSKFFLNDHGLPYKLSERKKGSGKYQPQALSVHFKRMIQKTKINGATPSCFRDSFIKAMYENGCDTKELMHVSGIKQKRTIDNKIKPQLLELDQVYKNLFGKVKYPFSDHG